MTIIAELVPVAEEAVRLICESRATVYLYSYPPDGSGGHTDTWTKQPGTLPVHVNFTQRPRQPHEVGERIASRNDAVNIVYPIGVELDSRDRLLVDDVMYEIDNVEDEGTWGILNRAFCIHV